MSKLIIGGFKSIRERTEIPLAPLTFLFGPNSAGKSAVLMAVEELREKLTAKPRSETLDALRAVAVKAGFVGGRRRYLRAFTDACGSVKVHDRYLLSVCGAIRFEYGFQQLTGKRTASVSPESPANHSELVRRFMEGDHDMDVETTRVML